MGDENTFSNGQDKTGEEERSDLDCMASCVVSIPAEATDFKTYFLFLTNLCVFFFSP